MISHALPRDDGAEADDRFHINVELWLPAQNWNGNSWASAMAAGRDRYRV